MKDKILQLSADIHPEVVAWRRHIHAHPELAFEESATASFVSKQLESFDIETTTGIAKTGVVGILKCNQPETACIALRADMDALPIEEQNQVSYASRYKGKMHACGHDVHTANLLGVAKILSELRHELSGTFKFIFQPSEERFPSGAAAMIAEGVLEQPNPKCIIGMHVSPEIEVGQLGFHSGKFMASSDEIYITVKGKGGHAAQPQNTINPLFAAASVLIDLESITDMQQPLILNFGKIEGLGATNVVPDKVELQGTLRCFDESLRSDMHGVIEQRAAAAAANKGATCMVNILKGYPVLVNHDGVTQHARAAAADILGNHAVIEVPQRMGSEDFAYYTHHVPACFFRLGVGNKAKGITSAIHTPTFDIDETALQHSVAAMSWMTIRLMQW